MITHIIIAISAWVSHVISSLGYPGVGFLMAIESAAIPLPSEVIMPFAGFLASSGRFNLWLLALSGATGSVVGSLVTYYIGFHGGKIWARKYERALHLSENELSAANKFFRKFPHSSTFFGRLLPIIRTFISIPAGIAKVPLWRFVIYCFAGSFIWSYFLAWLGKKLGDNWDSLGKYFHRIDLAVIAVVIVLILWWIWSWQRRNQQA